MRVHFIAIGGSAMHNLAIALHKKGYQVTGSDDEIFETSKSRLDKHGLLPETWGWFPEKISDKLDAIILGMHARKDNPELQKALSLGLKVYSYPEYIYSQTTEKQRVIIGGSHGKTTVTSMIMHALRYNKKPFDFMVGAQLEGFDTMVNLENETNIAVFEGDEYLSSPIDLRPKFLWYHPHIAVLTGIAWDHINVFPTFEMYVNQFELFANTIEDGGTLVYYQNDAILESIAKKQEGRLNRVPYQALNHKNINGQTIIHHNDKAYSMKVFGQHNLENLNAAMQVCLSLGIGKADFLESMETFAGAARRLQILRQEVSSTIFFDFAHSPSKLKATTNAVKAQYPNRDLIACMELHTFSSLSKDFLPQYKHTMSEASMAYVYYSPEVIKHKHLAEFNPEDVRLAFDQPNLTVFTDSAELLEVLNQQNWKNKNLLIMTSGNFNGIDIKKLASELSI
jgi:UDP-N-acetylmuramate: L-alanyl-gamma-D-glutamyl-meso-diaminopimelate ligase